MQALGRAAGHDVRIFVVGGTTAVIEGWRDATIDFDFVMRPEENATTGDVVHDRQPKALEVRRRQRR